MPTNLPANAKPVPLKNGEVCSLKRHFTGCARQVIAYLDLLASKDPDRVVWMRVDNIVAHCKNYSKKDKAGKPTLYKKSMVEKALKEFRDYGILSYPAKVPKHVRRGFVVTDCFVLAPHDALAVREPEGCRMVGPGRVPGTTWAATKGNVWYVGKGRKNLLESTVIFTVGITDQITDGITVPITDPITDGITVTSEEKEPEHYGTEYGHESGDTPEITEDNAKPQKVFQEFSEDARAPRPLDFLVSEYKETEETCQTNQTAKTGAPASPSSSSHSLTH